MVPGGRKVLPSVVSDIFLHYMPFFMIYQAWIDGYDRASEVVKQLCDNNLDEFLKRLRDATGDQTSSSSSFMALLIKPVQAVPRYRLLLERLSAAQPECVDACRSGDAIQEVATKLNESLKRKAAALRVVEIQNAATRHCENKWHGCFVRGCGGYLGR